MASGPMTAAQKIGATAMIIVAFLAMNKCDTDSAHNQPDGTSATSIDQAGLQQAWDDQTMETQLNICASWMEDREMATDLFYMMAIKNGVLDAPVRSEVQAFFDQKC